MSGGSEKKGILFEKNLVFEVIFQPDMSSNAH